MLNSESKPLIARVPLVLRDVQTQFRLSGTLFGPYFNLVSRTRVKDKR